MERLKMGRGKGKYEAQRHHDVNHHGGAVV
jgi:hypothetical protein